MKPAFAKTFFSLSPGAYLGDSFAVSYRRGRETWSERWRWTAFEDQREIVGELEYYGSRGAKSTAAAHDRLAEYAVCIDRPKPPEPKVEIPLWEPRCRHCGCSIGRDTLQCPSCDEPVKE